MIAEAVGMLERAATLARPGPYQLQAAIAACHAEAASFDATDWKQIVSLYDSLVELGDSPVIRLNRAVALSHVRGAELALDELGRLGTQLDTYHLYHATRAELLDQVGRGGEADGERRRALELTENTAERRLLEDAMAGNEVPRTGLRS
jgi:RNA polymerase sigma-70 factor (ECF subfamily)